MLSGRRTIGKDRGGAEDKKHNKKQHHPFVRTPRRDAPLKRVGFSHVSFLRAEVRWERGRAKHSE